VPLSKVPRLGKYVTSRTCETGKRTSLDLAQPGITVLGVRVAVPEGRTFHSKLRSDSNPVTTVEIPLGCLLLWLIKENRPKTGTDGPTIVFWEDSIIQ
jgi:hypothetical protein